MLKFCSFLGIECVFHPPRPRVRGNVAAQQREKLSELPARFGGVKEQPGKLKPTQAEAPAVVVNERDLHGSGQ